MRSYIHSPQLVPCLLPICMVPPFGNSASGALGQRSAQGPGSHSRRRRGSGFSGPPWASSSQLQRSRTSSAISDSA